MKKIILFSILFCFLIGCASTQTSKTYQNSLYKADDDRHDINNLISLKHNFDVEYVGTLVFTLNGTCAHSKAVRYARKNNLADELGSITMFQETIESKKVITETYYNGDENETTIKLPSNYKCSYSALGFKVVNEKEIIEELIKEEK